MIGDCGEGQPGIELVDVISQVKNQPEAQSFKVIITSEGGEVQTGQDIYSYLKSLKRPITTVGRGMVASIATVIFLAGDKRVIEQGCEFMIHFPMGNPQWLTADELEEYTKMVKKTENDLVKFYTEKTGMEKEAIVPMLRNETFLTSEQLKSFGFTTESEPLKIAAKASLNIHKKDKKMSKKEAKNLFMQALDVILGDDKKKKKKGKDPVNLILYNAEQEEVDFYELSDGDEVTTGAKARIDGKDAEGDVVMSDGRTFKFEGGELKEIVEAEGGDSEDPETLEEAMKMLDVANAEIIDLTREKESLEDDKQKLEMKVTNLKKELKEKNKVLDRIEKLRSKFDENGQSKEKKGGKQAKERSQSRFKKAMSNLKN